MERIVTPATPSQFDYEIDEDRSGFRCVGKSMTFQSKSHLSTPSIRTWLRSPNLNKKRKNVSPRPTELVRAEALNEEEQNASKSPDTRHTKQSVENGMFPPIVVNGNAKRTSSMCDCEKPRKDAAKLRKKDELQMKHNLPKVKTRQQTKLESELPDIIKGKIRFFHICFPNQSRPN